MKFVQDIIFKRSTAEVYDLFLNEQRFETISHAPTKIFNRVGGSYSVYNGIFTGIIKQLEPDKKIVLYFRKKEWPEGEQSKVTLEFETKQNNTVVHLIHEDIPKNFFDATTKIWKDYYWDIMEGKIE